MEISIRPLLELHNLSSATQPDQIYLGPRMSGLESERLLAATGFYFGPTYMLKALRGLKQLVARGTIGGSQRVLLIDTGGTNERDVLRGSARERPSA